MKTMPATNTKATASPAVHARFRSRESAVTAAQAIAVLMFSSRGYPRR
jgi:hypothetical protein